MDNLIEMQKEIADFKAHILKINNVSDMPFMNPVKALVNEQITAMYTFQSEIKNENMKQNERNQQLECLIDSLEKRLDALQLGLITNQMESP